MPPFFCDCIYATLLSLLYLLTFRFLTDSVSSPVALTSPHSPSNPSSLDSNETIQCHPCTAERCNALPHLNPASC